MTATSFSHIRPVTRNGITRTFTEAVINKKDKKGMKYPTVKFKEEELQDAIKFFGEKAVFNLLQQKVNSICQDVYQSPTVSKTEPQVNPETMKTVDTVLETNWDKFADSVEQLSPATGVSLAELSERMEELRGELLELVEEMQTVEAGSAEQISIVKRLAELRSELIETKKAADERSAMFRERFNKDEPAKAA